MLDVLHASQLIIGTLFLLFADVSPDLYKPQVEKAVEKGLSLPKSPVQPLFRSAPAAVEA